MWRSGLGIEQRVDFFAPPLLAGNQHEQRQDRMFGPIAPVRIEC